MTEFKLTVPSKTFLLGEYAVLRGGPAVVLTTLPRFQLKVRERVPSKSTQNTFQDNFIKTIHPNSPAGKLIQKYKEFFVNYDFQFQDPHQHLGGLGASSAQYLLIEAFRAARLNTRIDPFALMTQYLEVAWDGKGCAPSGADLVAQLTGGISCLLKAEKKLQILEWPFRHLEYCLIRTGTKIPTHEHLQTLEPFNVATLSEIALQGWESLVAKNDGQFIAAINHYNEVLQQQGLQVTKTATLVKSLRQNKKILAAKGCGALGADVILVIYEYCNADSVRTWLAQNHHQMIVSGNAVAQGLEVTINSDEIAYA